MFTKTNFKGAGMFKYTLGVFILKIILIGAFIATSIPYIGDIITHIEAVVNTGAALSLMFILKQIGWIFLWLVVTFVVEAIIVFAIILPMAKAELDRGW